ncbi:uncharacterized protein LOC114916771 [Cajanus cajan]|uniref:uncharacterized protein LOC114916771 n=1 Tax=Cajanus cajan TaxID=3821 RepID=UPI0010FB45F3|nr:uncharacterized protein LOC114916771 [Cajanus cajan]
MQPLIDELCSLWNDGTLTYDVSLRQNFMMKAALMWTINDFPAYGMLSGWSTAGRLGCPICMDKSKAFSLKNSRKVSYFDCHRQFLPHNHPYRKNKNSFKKRVIETSNPPPRLSSPNIWKQVAHLPLAQDRGDENPPHYGDKHNWTKQSIFWTLPYWKTHLLRHNIDVMHTERNVFMNVFNTVMDINGRTKDTNNARLDLAEICNRRELELKDVGRGKLIKPKATYALTKSQRVAICQWVKELKLPDGYASNLGRCVVIKEGKLHGMKSHDCHVFMQRLLPIAFDSLPKPIWKVLVELSHFFRELTSTTLNVEQLRVMENDIPVLLCKLEQIFPPSFFDSMEHLPIHLPYEARVGGPVQYRWMYPFERFLHSLKNKVKNKARVEASICEAYLVEETSTFASYYYPSEIDTRRTRMPRNVDVDEGSMSTPCFSVFNYPGKASGKSTKYFLDQLDLKATHLYVLQNCEEVEPYLDIYVKYLRQLNPTASDAQVGQEISSNFPTWFKEYVLNSENNVQDPLLRNLAWGPKLKVESWPIYTINGYKFHTGQLESDFYGKLTDIIQLEYTGLPIMKLILFKCDWFDNTPNIGTRVNDKYGVVEVRQSRRYNKAYDPFILAQQAEQVYFTPYPEGHNDWLAIIKTKARSRINDNILIQTEQEVPYQDDEVVGLQVMLHIDSDVIDDSLVDNDVGGEEVDMQSFDQPDMVDEFIEDKYISSEDDNDDENESDFNDTDEP